VEQQQGEIEIRTYLSGGINWNWYLQGLFDDANQTVTILFCDRFHKYDQPQHPLVDNPRADYEIVKDQNGVAEVKIISHDVNTIPYRVLNPKLHSWQYRDFTHMVLEGGK